MKRSWLWQGSAVGILDDARTPPVLTHSNQPHRKINIWQKLFRANKLTHANASRHRSPGMPGRRRMGRERPAVESTAPPVTEDNSRAQKVACDAGPLSSFLRRTDGPLSSTRGGRRRSENDTVLRESAARRASSRPRPTVGSGEFVTAGSGEKFPSRRSSASLSTTVHRTASGEETPGAAGARTRTSAHGTGTSLYPIEERPPAPKDSPRRRNNMRRFSTTDIRICSPLGSPRKRHSLAVIVPGAAVNTNARMFSGDDAGSPSGDCLTDRERAIVDVATRSRPECAENTRRWSFSLESSADSFRSHSALVKQAEEELDWKRALSGISVEPRYCGRRLMYGDDEEERAVMARLQHICSNHSGGSAGKPISNQDSDETDGYKPPSRPSTMSKLFGGVSESATPITSPRCLVEGMSRGSRLSRISSGSVSTHSRKDSSESCDDSPVLDKSPHFLRSISSGSAASEKVWGIDGSSFHFDEFVQDTIMQSATTSIRVQVGRPKCDGGAPNDCWSPEGNTPSVKVISMSPYEKGRPQSTYGGSSNSLKRFLETKMNPIFSTDKIKVNESAKGIEGCERVTKETWFDAERRTCRYLCHRFETLVDLLLHPPHDLRKNMKEDCDNPIDYITQKQWTAIAEGTQLLVQFNMDNLLMLSSELGGPKQNEDRALFASEILLVRAITRSIRRITLTLLYPQLHKQQSQIFGTQEKVSIKKNKSRTPGLHHGPR